MFLHQKLSPSVVLLPSRLVTVALSVGGGTHLLLSNCPGMHFLRTSHPDGLHVQPDRTSIETIYYATRQVSEGPRNTPTGANLLLLYSVAGTTIRDTRLRLRMASELGP